MSPVDDAHSGADTIAAVATPPGKGGIGVVRVSGPLARRIARGVLGFVPKARHARLAPFRDARGDPIDRGIAIFFAAPASYTGEDILELQGHGGDAVLDLVLRRALELGARLARPGEFTKRAFLNGKLDLAQAEAVADLIAARSERAARAARRTLDGALSVRAAEIQRALTDLRAHVEAALDFPDDELDLLADERVLERLRAVFDLVADLRERAGRGALLSDGARVVIAGPPNAGKSTLLNALAGEERAIVTDIAGTTRDVLRETVVLRGVPVTLVDTAGLQETGDPVEREGVRRAGAEIERADLVLWLTDATGGTRNPPPPSAATLAVSTKLDLLTEPERRFGPRPDGSIGISARTGRGLDALEAAIVGAIGAAGSGEGDFSARRRHVDALRCVADALERAGTAPGAELMAEELRRAQDALSEITGQVTADDLLDRIFSEFCIGK